MRWANFRYNDGAPFTEDSASGKLSTLRYGLVSFWNWDVGSSADLADTYGSQTLTKAGTTQYDASNGVVGGRLFKAENDTGYVYDATDTLANLAGFTYTAWVALPGLAVPLATYYRNPTWIASYDYSNYRVRMMYSIPKQGDAGDTTITLWGYWRDGSPADKSVSIAGPIDLSGSTAEYAGWHFLYTKFDGTTLTFGVRTSGNHYTKTATPVSGIPALTNADYFPWYPRPQMGSTTTDGDAFGVWNRALTASELDTLWNSGNGYQWSFL